MSERIIGKQPPGVLEEPSQQFGPDSTAVEVFLPDLPNPFAVRWSAEMYAAAGGDIAQLEAYLGGGATAATWARSNIARDASGWEATEGALLVEPSDPRRIQARIRSYGADADAKVRNCRVDAVELKPGLGHFWQYTPDHSVGSVGEQIPAGEARDVVELTVGEDVKPGPYLVVPTIEVRPNVQTGVSVFASLSSPAKEIPFAIAGGPPGRYVSRAPALWWQIGEVNAGDVLRLRLYSGPDYSVQFRRANLFLVNWAVFAAASAV